ncbi:hypothetical protein HNR16_003559 [Pseudoclavibacter chungangensis]|nr:hypothetical protein [Pseudoclavibacter chungangensis]
MCRVPVGDTAHPPSAGLSPRAFSAATAVTLRIMTASATNSTVARSVAPSSALTSGSARLAITSPK